MERPRLRSQTRVAGLIEYTRAAMESVKAGRGDSRQGPSAQQLVTAAFNATTVFIRRQLGGVWAQDLVSAKTRVLAALDSGDVDAMEATLKGVAEPYGM